MERLESDADGRADIAEDHDGKHRSGWSGLEQVCQPLADAREGYLNWERHELMARWRWCRGCTLRIAMMRLLNTKTRRQV